MEFVDRKNHEVGVNAIQWTGRNIEHIKKFVGSRVFDHEQLRAKEGTIGIEIGGNIEKIGLNDFLIWDYPRNCAYPMTREKFEQKYVAMPMETKDKTIASLTSDKKKLEEELRIAQSDNRDLKELIVKMSMRTYMNF